MSKKIKVLYIEPCPLNFGGYYRSLDICQALSRNNISVDLLLSSDKKFSFFISKKIINSNLSLYILPRFYLSYFISGHILRGLIATLFGIFGNYDIIQATSPVQPESNIPLSILKLFGKKIVVSWEDLWTESTSSFNKLVTLYLQFWENNSPRLFKNFQCISNILVKRAKMLGAINIIKIINGTDPNYFCPNKILSQKKLKLSPKYKYLLTFGNTFGGNRLYLTLLTFQKILSLYPQTKLIMNLNSNLNLLTKSQRHKILSSTFKHIINVGYIPEALLPYYQSASDATIFTMDNNINEKACFPVRIGKFISSESTIIINENFSETTSILKKYHCAIIDVNLDNLAKKTVSYFKDKKLQEKYHRNVVSAKTALSWDNLIIPLIALYKKII